MPRAGPRKVQRYTLEFKLKAVKLSQLKGVEVQAVADALEIHPFMLSKWRKDAREGVLRGRVSVPTALTKTQRHSPIAGWSEECRQIKPSIFSCASDLPGFFGPILTGEWRQFLQRREPMHVQTFLAKPSVEGFDRGVVGRLSQDKSCEGRFRQAAAVS